VTATDTHRAIDAVWRIESPRLIAGLARMVHDIGVAEDLAQDALVSALEQWPKSGVPDNPGAWLMAAAKHRAIDLFRRNQLRERKHEELGYELEAQEKTVPDLDASIDDPVGDDLLRLVFISCHPVLSTEAQVALTLRLLGGLTTEEIAARFPRPGANRRPAHRQGQTNSCGKACPFRASPQDRTRGAPVLCVGSHLPRL
jgi:RNA polymerase sigma factor (sigma-70 family)